LSAHHITSREALYRLYPAPSTRAMQKQLAALDRHCRHFISLSPFLVLATRSESGLADASPRGDAPGFVVVEDEKTLLIPDRPGNNRLDSLQNIIDTPAVGLLFLVPGINETLRVNGTAEIRTDPDLLARLAHQGKLPRAVLKVSVAEVYLHCAKALIRSKLWDEEAKIERSAYPSLGQILADQIEGLGDAAATDASLEKVYRETLY